MERIEAEALGLERIVDGVAIHAEGLRLVARHVVIAAGARSRPLAAMVGDRVPLDTERGYHVEWDMPEPPLTRPTCLTARGLYLCPMAGRLRRWARWSWAALMRRPRRTASHGWSRARRAPFRSWVRPTATGWASARRCPTACR